jgi:hypothetical protein
MKSSNGSVVERTKPIAERATKGASRLLNSFSFDPHPMRTKVIFGTKVAIPALIAGMFGIRAIARWMRGDGRMRSGS